MAAQANQAIHPRVRLRYENPDGEATELPLVAGVVGNFSGTTRSSARLRERDFISVDRGNFDSVVRRLEPTLAFRVDNKLVDDGSQLAMSLRFESLADFGPEAVAQQIDPLRKLLEVRETLSGVRRRIARSKELGARIRQTLEADARGGEDGSEDVGSGV